MRLKNPDDQRFIAKASDMVSKADLEELPSLSTGEALCVVVQSLHHCLLKLVVRH